MSIIVIYESMFGNTRQLAGAIAQALEPYGAVKLLNVNNAVAEDAAASAALLVVGGPTHVHGMSRPSSREEARSWAKDPSKTVALEPLAPGTGVREFLDRLATLENLPLHCAAFDTRMDISRILSGAASGRIEHALVKRGSRAVVPAASFLVTKHGVLATGELDRARTWGASVGAAAALSIPS